MLDIFLNKILDKDTSKIPDIFYAGDKVIAKCNIEGYKELLKGSEGHIVETRPSTRVDSKGNLKRQVQQVKFIGVETVKLCWPEELIKVSNNYRII